MSLGEYLPNSNTKLLLHLNGSSADSSGNGNNGTDTAITYSQANGKFGQGAGFNGSNSKISWGNFGSSSWTIRCWFKTTFPISASSPYYHTYCIFSNDGTENFYGINNSGLSYYEVYFENTWVSNTWNQIFFTYSGTTLTGYVNGKQAGSATYTNRLSSTSTNRQIGMRLGGANHMFLGSIDEVIVESRECSASEVKKYYTFSKGRFGII